MSKISRFEDLEIWQFAREMCKQIFLLTQTSPFSRDFALVDQIKRASGSTMDNIAEGFERDGNKEFHQFLSIAKSSAGEVRSQLYRALDSNYIDESEFNKLVNHQLKLSTKIKNMMTYLKNTELKGHKFKLQKSSETTCDPLKQPVTPVTK